MTFKPVLFATALALFPAAAIGAQDLPLTGPSAVGSTRALPPIDSVANAAVEAAMPGATDDAAQRLRSGERRWVGRAKWTLLATAAGFGAYALANSRTEHTDRRAQIGILGGQLSLLASVGLFIYDLRADHETPENIPFEQATSNPSDGSGSRSQP